MIVEGSKPSEVLEFRFMLESENASYAAKKGDGGGYFRIRQAYEKDDRKQNDITQFAYYDTEFHMQVAKAAHNELLYKMMRASYSTIKKGVKQANINATV